MFKIAVLASTRGTDLQAIIDEIKAGTLEGVELSFVLSNKRNCGAMEKAKNHNIPAIFANAKNKSREEYDREIVKTCETHGVNLVVLVGWMRILSSFFVKKLYGKVINVHPSLLPKYPGMDLDVHTEVLKNKEKKTGMTIHFVDEGVDTGPTILQKSLQINPGETSESLRTRVQALEKHWYPQVIGMFRDGLIRLEEDAVVVSTPQK